MRLEKLSLLVILLSISFLFFLFSPQFFNLMEHDSKSYIEFSSERTAIYPIFLSLFDQSNYYLIIIIQYTILSSSIFFLSYTLYRFRISNLLILSFFILCHLNFYYFSFSKTILTEAFFFSSINLLVGLMLANYKVPKKTNFFFIGMLSGIIASIKSIGIIISLTCIFFLFYFYFKSKISRTHLIIFFFSFLPPIIFENYFYYKNHDSRNSVLHTALIGKAFVISKAIKNPELLPIEYNNIILKMQNESNKVEKFLDNISNPWLYADLKSDYEVVFQSQVLKKELVELSTFLGISTKETFTNIGLFIIRTHPLEYIKVSLWHYFNLWSPGGKKIFFDDYLKNNTAEVPFKQELLNASGEIKYEKKIPLFLSLLFFNLIFFLHVFIFISKFSKNENFSLRLFLFFFINLYLLAISFINISTPRYYMPIFPIVLIFIFLESDNLFKKMIKIIKIKLNK